MGVPLQRLLDAAAADTDLGGASCALTGACVGAYSGVAVAQWGQRPLGRVFVPAGNLWLNRVASELPVLPDAPTNRRG
jgi:phage tail tape-measure protein